MGSGPPKGVSGTAVVEEMRQFVVGVNAGGDDDVEIRLAGDALDAGDIAAEAGYCEIDDRVYAGGLQLIHAGDGVGYAFVFVAPFFGIVLD